MDEGIKKTYGGRIRIRACGLCWREGQLLMVNHKGITASDFWAPPGGGLDFGESIEDCLQRELQEETGLVVSAPKFLFGCEFIQSPLHAIELFFQVTPESGTVKNGYDPELQIIREVRFLSTAALAGIPRDRLHGIFKLVQTPGDLHTLTGFFRI
jgi:8-oxo-dGTP diphosphatase